MAIFFSTDYAQKIIIFSSTGEPVFDSSTIIDCIVRESSTYAQHTIEDGSNISDHRFRNQNRISIQLLLDKDIYEESFNIIKNLVKSNEKFTIQTKTDVYENMYLEAYPHQETSRVIDTIIITLNFVEQIIVLTESSKLTTTTVKNSEDASTVKRGNLQGEDITEKVEGSLIFEFLGG